MHSLYAEPGASLFWSLICVALGAGLIGHAVWVWFRNRRSSSRHRAPRP